MDWGALLVVLLFALRGFREGVIRQLFTLLGWTCGLVSLIAVSQWVGAHWQGARPSAVFGVLRWLVALLAGFAVVAIFQLIGERIGDAVQKSVVVWLDRLGGLVFGAGLGTAAVVAVLVGMLLTPWPREAARIAAGAHFTRPLLAVTRSLLSVDRFFPGLSGLRRAVDDAARRSLLPSRQS